MTLPEFTQLNQYSFPKVTECTSQIFETYNEKIYFTGILEKKSYQTVQGNRPTGAHGSWSKWKVQVKGSQLLFWPATTDYDNHIPNFLSIRDARLTWHKRNIVSILRNSDGSLPVVLCSTRGLNKIGFKAENRETLHHWILAVFTSQYEFRCLNLWYTVRDLFCRPRIESWIVSLISGGRIKLDEQDNTIGSLLQVRFPHSTEWKEYYCVLRYSLQQKKSVHGNGRLYASAKNQLLVYTNANMSKLVAEINGLRRAYALYPEGASNEQITRTCTQFCVEGSGVYRTKFQGQMDGDALPWFFLMAQDCQEMIRWLGHLSFITFGVEKEDGDNTRLLMGDLEKFLIPDPDYLYIDQKKLDNLEIDLQRIDPIVIEITMIKCTILCYKEKLNVAEKENIIKNNVAEKENIIKNNVAEKENIIKNNVADKENIIKNNVADKENIIKNNVADKENIIKNNVARSISPDQSSQVDQSLADENTNEIDKTPYDFIDTPRHEISVSSNVDQIDVYLNHILELDKEPEAVPDDRFDDSSSLSEDESSEASNEVLNVIDSEKNMQRRQSFCESFTEIYGLYFTEEGTCSSSNEKTAQNSYEPSKNDSVNTNVAESNIVPEKLEISKSDNELETFKTDDSDEIETVDSEKDSDDYIQPQRIVPPRKMSLPTPVLRDDSDNASSSNGSIRSRALTASRAHDNNFRQNNFNNYQDYGPMHPAYQNQNVYGYMNQPFIAPPPMMMSPFGMYSSPFPYMQPYMYDQPMHEPPRTGYSYSQPPSTGYSYSRPPPTGHSYSQPPTTGYHSNYCPPPPKTSNGRKPLLPNASSDVTKWLQSNVQLSPGDSLTLKSLVYHYNQSLNTNVDPGLIMKGMKTLGFPVTPLTPNRAQNFDERMGWQDITLML